MEKTIELLRTNVKRRETRVDVKPTAPPQQDDPFSILQWINQRKKEAVLTSPVQQVSENQLQNAFQPNPALSSLSSLNGANYLHHEGMYSGQLMQNALSAQSFSNPYVHQSLPQSQMVFQPPFQAQSLSFPQQLQSSQSTQSQSIQSIQSQSVQSIPSKSSQSIQSQSIQSQSSQSIQSQSIPSKSSQSTQSQSIQSQSSQSIQSQSIPSKSSQSQPHQPTHSQPTHSTHQPTPPNPLAFAPSEDASSLQPRCHNALHSIDVDREEARSLDHSTNAQHFAGRSYDLCVVLSFKPSSVRPLRSLHV